MSSSDGVWLVRRAACTASPRCSLARWHARAGRPSATAPRSPRSSPSAAALAGVRLASGERIAADAVIANADVAALATGLFGEAARSGADKRRPAAAFAVGADLGDARACHGFPLVRHNVFFSADYPAEFDTIFRDQRLPSSPTVYVCAQDRDDAARGGGGGTAAGAWSTRRR